MTSIGILVVAYNAAGTLHRVLDRIPEAFRSQITQILVSDDASDDATYLVGLGYQQTNEELPLVVVRQPANLGYGGNQKAGYEWSMDHDLDVVVLLHGDGQYAPELLPEIVAPLLEGRADAVLGSRMLDRGAARRGGMPLYKYFGNRILTTFENKVMGTHLSEWHSGYRAYSVDALRSIPFTKNDNGFAFDTEIIVQLLEADRTIVEVPIPTYYGDEISHVNGIRYAWEICSHVMRYRLQKMGFGSGDLVFNEPTYDQKLSHDSSHSVITRWVADRTPRKILDLGCDDGALGAHFRAAGHQVTGVDIREHDGVRDRLDMFAAADLDKGLPTEVGDGYDLVVAADILEHLRAPDRLLREIRDVLDPNGSLIASVPNMAHWYPRARVATGRFDYDRRGILDRDHLRFFTRRTFERMAKNCGYRVVRAEPSGLPLEAIERGGASDAGGLARRWLQKADHAGVVTWPNLFAYQWIFELQPQ